MEEYIVADNKDVKDEIKDEEVAAEEVANETDPHIYSHGICAVGEKSVIPSGVTVGKNTCIGGITTEEDYPDNTLPSGRTLIKAGE